MKLNYKFTYEKLDRVTNADGTRYYVEPKTRLALPSVTTILSATADKTGIALWEEFVGPKKAKKEKDYATALGTLVHTHIEKYILGDERPGGNNIIRVQSKLMSDQIINRGLSQVDEVWGQEVALYFPGFYAGTTDLVGVHQGEEAIMDHKTAKKMRSRDMIEDYFCQMAAYALAHNEVYGTNIRKGVIFMVDRQLQFSEFILGPLEMERYTNRFLERAEVYFRAQLEEA